MRDRVVIVEIPLNTVNRWLHNPKHIQPQGLAKDRLTQEWIANRLDLFFTYTLPSLRQQTNQDFTAVVLFDARSKAIFSEELRRRPPLPANILFLTEMEFFALEDALIAPCRYYCHAFLGSDDMYHRDFMQSLHDYEPHAPWMTLVPQYGYAFVSPLNRLGPFYFWLPSYGAIMMLVDEYVGQGYPSLSWMDAMTTPHEHIWVQQPAWINHAHGTNMGVRLETFERWLDPDGASAFAVEPWPINRRIRARFGPVVTDPDEMAAILADYY
jgi:hypothetical protein